MRAVLVLVLATGGVACSSEQDEPPGRLGTGHGPPLIVIAVDGATWDVIDPMMERGELPHFANLVERGVRGTLISLQPYTSPVVWTTMATGRFPREHNILDHVFPYGPGLKQPVNSTLRRVPALWNIASEYGRSIGSVGYFVTHPAERVNGFMISDRAHQALESSAYPEDLEAVIRAVRSELDDPGEQQRLLRRFVPWSYDRSVLQNPDHPLFTATRVVADRVDYRIIQDDFVRRLTLRLLPSKPDLFLTYFRMVDHASHAGWLYYDTSDFDEKPDPRDRELLGDLIPESYRYIDEILGEIVARVGPEANLVVLSDHGFGSATGHYSGRADKPDVVTGNHRPDGILLAAGPDFRHGTVERITIVDIAPTLLALLELPISRELPGRVATELWRSGRSTPRPETVPRYRLDWEPVIARGVDTQAEEESLRTLRALGYIGTSSPSVAGSSGHEGTEFWGASVRLKRRALAGELAYYLLRGQQKRALRLRERIAAESERLLEAVQRQLSTEIRLLEQKLGRKLVADSDLEAVLALPGAMERAGD